MENISRMAKIRSNITTLLSAGVTFVTDAREAGYDQSMYFRTLFGYIALTGTSAKAQHYEDVDIIGDRVGSQGLDSRGTVNISEQVKKMMAYSRTVPGGVCRGLTLRQMCEPFAEEARDCLTILATLGVYSRLASKMTKLGQKEPQVMFDFNSGLNLLTLSATEAAAIQSLNSRLFRTEGAKNVFTAQASVGEQSVEI
uniref:Coat protein n=1 Tax=Grapevine virus B TaxID=35289 RepID=A0A7S6SMS6_9VIRU|nr:coat protein [Grapevine virus B]